MSRAMRVHVRESLCFRFMSVIRSGCACRSESMSEAAFRKDETGRVRLAVPKRHAKEIVETPVSRGVRAKPGT